jgi:DNA (cytosine-5)-methyltransferase 1
VTEVRPRLLDLFCGGGGAAMGYHRAGFDVTGVDVTPQPRYPFRFWQLDALALEPWVLSGFDAVHASPPCQAYSTSRSLSSRDHPKLIEPTRALLAASGLPYVIENVSGAPLLSPALLCGSMFGLDVKRHRLFETNWPLLVPTCHHGVWTNRYRIRRSRGRAAASTPRVVSVYGHATEYESLEYVSPTVQVTGSSGGKGDDGKRRGVELWRHVMEIDWLTAAGLSQAIPPAYAEWVGHQLRAYVAPAEPATAAVAATTS